MAMAGAMLLVTVVALRDPGTMTTPAQHAGAAQGSVAAAPLGGAHEGPTTPFTHPRGWLSFDLPIGWSVAGETEDVLAINPGLTRSDTLDALVSIHVGELEPAAAQLDIVELFRRMQPTLLQDVRAQGIEVVDDDSLPQRVTLAHATGLVKQWKGKANGRDVQVWFGGLAERGYYLTVNAVVLAGKEERFLPGVKRILHSMQARPPQRHHAAERALEGARFAAVDTRPGGSSGSFSSILEFGAGNRVKKTMILSGRLGLSGVGGSSEEWGLYEVVGDEVRLSFADGPDALVLTIEQGRIVALERGERIYRRR